MAQQSPASITPLTPRATITPSRKRRTRPSFSPVKTPKVLVPQRSASATWERPKTSPQEPLPSTAAVEFPEFSFVGPNGNISKRNVSAEHLKAFQTYLVDQYDAVYVQYYEPFLILECESGMPPEDQRPFSIAGLVVIWMSVETAFYFHPVIGDYGQTDTIQIDSRMLGKMERYTMPPDDVILYLANQVFPDCEAISLLWNTLVVELPDMSVDDFVERVKSLPEEIEGFPYFLQYFKGPLPNTPRRSRERTPRPAKRENLVADETDYAKLDGKFYPGSMISSLNKDGGVFSSISAGVLVKKGQERRLTCSWHNWEQHAEKYPGKFGQADAEAQSIFRVAQGLASDQDGTKAGTAVGFVRERMGVTDIALAQLDDGIVFENKFMEIGASAKAFIPSGDQILGDRYEIDSFVTGLQPLVGYGVRAALTRRRRSTAHPELYAPAGRYDSLPSDDVVYIKAKQGVYATNAPLIDKLPQIRDSVCGSVLIRCSSSYDPEAPIPTKSEVLKRGEICGMVHYADLQARFVPGHIPNYLIYADAFDPLIEDGWTIVQTDEPMENAQTEEEDKPEPEEPEPEAELEESPSKKQRTV